MADNAGSSVATLFADIVGSTGLYERFGDRAAHAAIGDCLERLKRVASEHGGRTVKTIGDELMAVFPDAAQACLAAAEMQWQVEQAAPLEDHRLEIRVACHYGAAVERDGDVFGDSVNVAARLAELAKARQVLTSGQTLSACGRAAPAVRHLWPTSVRGRSEPVDLFEILWDGGDATVTLSSHFVAERVPVRMRLVYRGHEAVIDAVHPRCSIGRDSGNELVVDARNASRVHARIELRRDKFVLLDLSTNGTFVLAPDAPEARLRREELILEGVGSISLGRSHFAGPRDYVEFYCEYASPGSRTMPRPAPAASR